MLASSAYHQAVVCSSSSSFFEVAKLDKNIAGYHQNRHHTLLIQWKWSGRRRR